MGAFQGGPGMAAVAVRMSSLEGRHQWRRHKLFKLRAKPAASQKMMLDQYNERKFRPNVAARREMFFAF
jgi:hypothetical protein